MQIADQIEANPTEAQKAAGNYRKAHVSLHGLKIALENAKGSTRSGTDGNGKAWKCTLPAHYGYIKKTEGADGDHVDAYIGPHPNSTKVFVIDQIDHKSKRFDEHKCMLGFANQGLALATYRRAFSDGKGHARIGAVTPMNIDQFKDWLRNSDTSKKIVRATGGRVDYETGGTPALLSDSDLGLDPPKPPDGLMSDADLGLSTGNEGASKPPMGWGDVASGAVNNAIPSLKQLGSDFVQPFLHPVDTAKAIGQLGLGAAEKLIPGGEYPHEKYADAFAQHFVDRYGGMENLKKTMATDPAGFLADAATVLSGGSMAAARAPGAMGTVARVAGTVGNAIDPLMAPLNAAKAVGTIIPSAMGMTTGVGETAVRNAFHSGVEGGRSGEAFRENLRGVTSPAEVVDDARTALRTMRGERSAQYVQDMAALGTNPKVLQFTDIDNAVASANRVKKFGTQELSPSTAKVRGEIGDVIDEWKSLDPAQYHTVLGLDALKQRIGDIKDALPFNTPERLVAEKVYSAVRQTIVKQAPEYAKIMKGYETASNQIDEIARTLSLNPKASVDTALRKLQSAIRNNVNTNYGNRTKLAETLSDRGAPELMEKLSGQAMNTWMPRGLGAGIGAAEAAHLAVSGLGHMTPAVAAMLPLSSPRLVGEAVHGVGRTVGAVPKAIRSLRAPEGTLATARGARLVGEVPEAIQPRSKGGRADQFTDRALNIARQIKRMKKAS